LREELEATCRGWASTLALFSTSTPKTHYPPHVHAIYGDDQVELDIATSFTGAVLVGALPGAKLRQASAWLEQNRAVALAAWERLNP
jgi:hypothetical protein